MIETAGISGALKGFEMRKAIAGELKVLIKRNKGSLASLDRARLQKPLVRFFLLMSIWYNSRRFLTELFPKKPVDLFFIKQLKL